MKFVKLLIVSTLFNLLISSCINNTHITTQTILSSNVPSLSFTALGNEAQNLTISSNSDWQITLSDTNGSIDWLEIAPMVGSGDMELSIRVKENQEGVNRIGYINIAAGEEIVQVEVTQEQNNIFDIDKNDLIFEATGGSQNVVLNNNLKYTIEIPTEADWLSHPASKAASSDIINFVAEENKTGKVRYADVIIRGTDTELTQTITVTQKQDNVFDIDKNDLIFEATGGSQNVVFNNNLKYTIEIPTEADWLSHPASKAVSSDIINFVAEENTTGKARYADVIIRGTDTELTQTITVTQKQNNIFDIDKNDLIFEAIGGSQNVVLNNNLKYTIEIPTEADWLSQPASKAASSDIINFVAEENTTGKVRYADVIIRGTDTELTQTVTVTQKQNNVFAIDKNDLMFEAAGGPQNVALNNNLKYTIEIPAEADWLSQPASRAVSNDIINFVAEENLTSEARTASIRISSTEADFTETVTITQKRYEGSAINAQNSVLLNYLDDDTYTKAVTYGGSHNVKVFVGGVEVVPSNGGSLITADNAPKWLSSAIWSRAEDGKSGNFTFVYTFQMEGENRDTPFEIELRSGTHSQKMVVEYNDPEEGLLSRNLIDYGALVDPVTNTRGSLSGMFVYGGEVQTLNPRPAWLTSVTTDKVGERQVIRFTYKPEKTDKADYQIVINNATGESKTFTLVYDNGYISSGILNATISASIRNDWAPNGLLLAKKGFVTTISGGDKTVRGVYPYETSDEERDYEIKYKTSESKAPEGVESTSRIHSTKYGKGIPNTNIMVAADNTSGKKEYSASIFCRNMGSDWYLNSIKELIWIHTNKAYFGESYTYNIETINGITTYWSSTESYDDSGWYINLYSRGIENKKTYKNNARCIRNL